MTYEEWEEKAESYETLQVSRDIVRDCYVFPNGVHCMEDFVLPWNPFAKSFSIVVVSHMVKDTEMIQKGEISKDYYTPDGYGVPVFRGDTPMKDAFEYAMSITNKEVLV